MSAPPAHPETPLRHRRLTEQVADALAGDIIGGRLLPGETLPSEPELVARFGISKVAVREAVQVLAAIGLVSVQQGRRSLVLGPHDWNFMSQVVQDAIRIERGEAYLLDQLYAARLILEPAVAAEAAAAMTAEAASELAQLVETMEALAEAGSDVEAFLEADRAFHSRLTDLVKSDVVRSMVRDVHRQMHGNWSGSRLDAHDLRQFASQHAGVLAAVRAGDASRAQEAMQQHLLAARDLELQRRAENNPSGDMVS